MGKMASECLSYAMYSRCEDGLFLKYGKAENQKNNFTISLHISPLDPFLRDSYIFCLLRQVIEIQQMANIEDAFETADNLNLVCKSKLSYETIPTRKAISLRLW